MINRNMHSIYECQCEKIIIEYGWIYVYVREGGEKEGVNELFITCVNK